VNGVFQSNQRSHDAFGGAFESGDRLLLALAGQHKRSARLGAIEIIQQASSLGRELCRVDAGPCWNRQGKQHSGDRGVHARFVHEEPEPNTEDQKGGQASYP
jgi:hypothetical protein